MYYCREISAMNRMKVHLSAVILRLILKFSWLAAAGKVACFRKSEATFGGLFVCTEFHAWSLWILKHHF